MSTQTRTMTTGTRHQALVSAAVALAAPWAQAQGTWPARPVTVVVPFPPGGGTDAFARPLFAQMSKNSGRQFVIDNKGGAGGNLGAGLAAKAAADGYTFFLGAVHHAIAPSMYPKLDHNIETGFIPVGLVSSVPQVVVVNPARVQATNLKELIAFLGKNPARLNYGSAGNGTSHHLMFDGLGSSANHIKAGRLRALAVADTQRAPGFPDLPTAAEAGLPGHEVSTCYGIFAPKGTPRDVVAAFQAEMRKALGSDEIKAAWNGLGTDSPNLYGDVFGGFLNKELKRWAGVVKRSGAKLE